MSTSWHSEDHPELRSGPPWVMEEMMAAEPQLAMQMLSTPSPEAAGVAREIAGALSAGRAVTVTGCGTSEHAAHGVAALIASALAPEQQVLVRARPALSAALEPADGLCLAISHDGGTRATALAAAAAKKAGARTAAITHAESSVVAAGADRVLLTPVHDRSWCHTIAYASALLAGASIAAQLGPLAAEAGAARDLLRAGVEADARHAAEVLARARILLCAGAALDRVTARELALKVAEGSRMPAVGLELETVLHGQLAGQEPPDCLVLVAFAGGSEAGRVARRAGHVAQACAAIGLPVAGLLSSDYDSALPAALMPAGRVVIELPEPSRLDGRLAALLAGAGALQALTLHLASARGTNPDLIRREEEPYRRAAEAGEGSRDW
jgi:fructoselysine-6-P-deglycase FrlB-like protein